MGTTKPIYFFNVYDNTNIEKKITRHTWKLGLLGNK